MVLDFCLQNVSSGAHSDFELCVDDLDAGAKLDVDSSELGVVAEVLMLPILHHFSCQVLLKRYYDRASLHFVSDQVLVKFEEVEHV